MAGKAALLQFSRKVHLYFGLFISPALLFFAFTGAYQTLGLHEAASDYKPPRILAELGQVHKKQTLVMPVRRGAGPEGARPDAGRPAPGNAGSGTSPEAGADRDSAGQSRPGRDRANRGDHAPGGAPTSASPRAGIPAGQPQPSTLATKQRQHLPLKLFFVLVSLGLLISTVTGIYMAYKYDRNKLLVTGLLVAGIVVPLVLVRF